MDKKEIFIEHHLQEIISELARVGRPDLIIVLKAQFDYYPDTDTEEEEVLIKIKLIGL
tara:strand:- start:482 stop:655 length:174 start_codon:yes stop_codon:yes gene_type:complete